MVGMEIGSDYLVMLSLRLLELKVGVRFGSQRDKKRGGLAE